jgi:hypothetical protein
MLVNCKEYAMVVNAVAGELDVIELEGHVERNQIELIDVNPIVEDVIKQQINQCIIER